MNLKKNGKVFTSKSVGTGPSSCEEKKYLPGRGLTKVEEQWDRPALGPTYSVCTGVKRPGLGVNHSLSSSAKIDNKWLQSATPPTLLPHLPCQYILSLMNFYIKKQQPFTNKFIYTQH